jgi:hypothetical protein
VQQPPRNVPANGNASGSRPQWNQPTINQRPLPVPSCLYQKVYAAGNPENEYGNRNGLGNLYDLEEALPSPAEHNDITTDQEHKEYDKEDGFSYLVHRPCHKTDPIPEDRRCCKRCNIVFPSRNKLFMHLRNKCNTVQIDVPDSPEAPAHVTTRDAVGSEPTTKEPQEKVSTAPPLGIGTGFGYKGHTYMTCSVSLSKAASAERVCMDTGCRVTLVNDDFLRRQAPEIQRRTIATPVTVGGISENKHTTDQYAIITIPMLRVDQETREPAITLITRELHVVKNLQANMLVGTDIITPEQMDVLLSQNVVSIGSCGVDVPVCALAHRSGTSHWTVHSKSTVSNPPHTATVIPIHQMNLGHNAIFRPLEIDHVSLFASILSRETTGILVRNDTSRPVQIR